MMENALMENDVMSSAMYAPTAPMFYCIACDLSGTTCLIICLSLVQIASLIRNNKIFTYVLWPPTLS